ncbi:MAG: AsmA family protein [Owenweeksia sp.]|nr:AsmA family protein [Owenweeksia sp.]
MGKPRHISLKILRWLGMVLLCLFTLFIILVLVVRTPWAQEKITDYATGYVTEKTGAEFKIDRLFITFRGNVQLEGLYLESLNKDTLLYSRSLEAGVEILPLLSNQIHVSRIDWDGLRAQVHRRRDGSFNFDFVIDSLASATPDTTVVKKDTSSSAPPEIAIGPISFRNFKLQYLDSLAGIDASTRIGELELTTDQLDLEKWRSKSMN